MLFWWAIKYSLKTAWQQTFNIMDFYYSIEATLHTAVTDTCNCEVWVLSSKTNYFYFKYVVTSLLKVPCYRNPDLPNYFVTWKVKVSRLVSLTDLKFLTEQALKKRAYLSAFERPRILTIIYTNIKLNVKSSIHCKLHLRLPQRW